VLTTEKAYRDQSGKPFLFGGQGRNRTIDTRIFSPLRFGTAIVFLNLKTQYYASMLAEKNKKIGIFQGGSDASNTKAAPSRALLGKRSGRRRCW